MVFSKISAIILLAAVVAQAQDTACVNDCASSSGKGFNCVALDTKCFCDFDDGKFFPKFQQCITEKCPQFVALIAQFNCPSPSTGSVVPTTGSDTVTFTNKEPVTSTVVTSSVQTGTATLIDESSTQVFTTSGIVITTSVVEGSVTRVLTLTTQTVGNVTTANSGSSSSSGSGSGSVIIVPSTVQSTITSADSTITTPVSTVSSTSTAGGNDDNPEQTVTSTTGAANALGSESGVMAIAMGMGALAGWLGLM